MFRNTRRLIIFGGCLALCAVMPHAQAQSFVGQNILATANIFGAGNPGSPTPNPGGGSGGTAAPGFTLTPGSGRVLTFGSVTGLVSLSVGVSTTPDGLTTGGNAPFGLSMNATSFQGISGIQLNQGSGFLTGVFVSSTTPVDPAPARLSFTNNGTPGLIGTGFTSLSPLLNQTFFIGDGLTGNGGGIVQQFLVPDGATQLFLGYADAPNYNGAPGEYGDNSGSVTASFQVVTPVAATPEPGSFALMAGILVGGGSLYLRRRRK